jgi:hypothetical protein
MLYPTGGWNDPQLQYRLNGYTNYMNAFFFQQPESPFSGPKSAGYRLFRCKKRFD